MIENGSQVKTCGYIKTRLCMEGLISMSLFLIWAVLILPVQAAASGPGDVITELRTYVSRDAVHPGETFDAAVRLGIGPEWHINANPASDELLIPTSLEFAEGPAPFRVLEIAYPEPHMARFGFSESEVAVYSESALIGARIRTDGGLKPGTYALKGKITFQACNEVSCLPPEAREFEVAIVVAEAGRETRGIDADLFATIKFGSAVTDR